MIDLYSWKTPNGHKVHIALEEMELDYELHPVNLGQGQQFEPEFLAVSPNNKIPAVVDREGPGGRPLSVFESGAILVYLAEKCGRLLPADPGRRAETLQWLMWQMGGIGPMMGQAYHFIHAADEEIPYAIARYGDEVRRLFGVADRQLAGRPCLAGDYSIADIAAYPWMRLAGQIGIDLEPYPHVRRWLDEVGERPAVQKGLTLIE
jgi:GST-like protein